MPLNKYELPWDSQPQEVAPLDPSWIAKGLVYANTLIHPVDAFAGRQATFVGTRGSIPSQSGLMRGFGATLGAGTTDSLNTGFTQDAIRRSYIIRVSKNAAGGGSLARIFTKFTSGTENELLYADSTGSNRLSFERRFSGGNNQTFWTNLANGEACVLGVTFDASSPTSVAALWKDGAKQTHTGNATTTGAVTANTQAMVVGNRVSDNARNWDGLLSDFLIFDAILSDGDMATLTRNPESVFAPRSIWVPVSASAPAPSPTRSIVEVKVPWDSQPQEAVEVNRGNPLGARLRYASTLGPNVLDVTSGRLATINNAPLTQVGPKGLFRDFVPASSQFLTLPTGNIVSGYPLTVSAWIRFDNLSTTGFIAYSLIGSTYGAIFGQSATLANTLVFNTGSAPGFDGFSAVTAGIVAGEWNHYVLVHRSGSAAAFLNGKPVTITNTGGNYGEPAAGNQAIGQRLNGASPRYFDGGIQDFYVFEGELTAAEALSLYQDRYQVFAPRSIWVPVSTPPAVPTRRRLIEQVTPWESQPQESVELNPEFGPVAGWVGTNPFVALPSGTADPTFTGWTFGTGLGGRGADFTSSNTQRVQLPGAISPGTNFIAVVCFQTLVTTSAGIFMSGKTHWTQANGFNFTSKSDVNTLELNGGDNTFPTIAAPGIGNADGVVKTLVVRFRGTSADVFLNGVSLGTVTITAAGTWPSGLGIGNYSGTGAGNLPNRRFYMGAVVRHGDPLELSKNPWQLFAPRTTYIPGYNPYVTIRRTRKMEMPWDSQPQEESKASPNWLRAYNFAQSGFDAAGIGRRYIPGNLNHVVGRAGRALLVNNHSQATSGELVSNISDAITFVIIAEKMGSIAGTSNFLIGETETGGANYNFGFYESFSTSNISFFLHNGTTGLNSGNGTAWVVGSGPQVWVATYGDGDANIRLYLNGQQVASGAQTGTIRRLGTALLRSAHWSTGVPNFRLYAAAISNRCMSASEVAEKFCSVDTAYGSIFAPRQEWILSSSEVLMPTLSLPTLTGIGSTTARPRVSITY